MKKLISCFLILFLSFPLLYAGWIEENGSACQNSLYAGSLVINGTDGTDVITLNQAGTMSIAGVLTLTSMPVLNGGADINGSVDIDLDAASKEFNITQSSKNCTVATIYVSATDLDSDTVLLSLDMKDDGDTNGTYLQGRDNSSANIVFKFGADGALTIDASGGGSGTVLSEATLVANDAAFRIDSETQDLQIGDGTNNTVVSDDGALSQTGDASAALLDLTVSGDEADFASYAIFGSSNMAFVPISYSLDDTKEIALEALYADADTKAGTFCVMMGTYCAMGSFTTAGAVTLTDNSSTDTSTTDNNDTTFNVFDNGDCITFENQTGGTLVLFGWVSWQN